MLECRGVSVRYGQHQALHDVAVRTAPGEIVVILGANGAGKSTLLGAIAGLVPCAPSSQIRVDGQSVAHLPPHRIVQAGVALVPEGRRLFGDLTVQENLLLGAYPRRARAGEREHLEQVLTLFPRLAERRNQVARNMSGGEQQMVAIGRAVMSAPSILMLDEPSLGLSPLLCAELFRTLTEIRGTGVGILLVEQNAGQALAIADRGYLLENGRIVGEDTAARLSQDSAVREAYLGGPAAKATPAPAARAALASPREREQGTERGSGDIPAAGSIAALVSRATQVQAEHIERQRTAYPTAHPATHPTTHPMAVRSPEDFPEAGSIAALVNRATQVQAEHIERQRAAYPTAHPTTHPMAVRSPNAQGTAPDRTAFDDRVFDYQAFNRAPVERSAANSGAANGRAANGASGDRLGEALARIEAAAAAVLQQGRARAEPRRGERRAREPVQRDGQDDRNRG